MFNDDERMRWVLNTESLKWWFQSCRRPMHEFLREYGEDVDLFIESQIGKEEVN